jgi:leucyl/phenylalanyl-tRNA--protein transferase
MAFQLLDDLIIFPDTALADPDGLLAVGGDLSLERLHLAYQSGIFPWYNEQPILWFAPHERCVLSPQEIKISKSMRKLLQASVFEVRVNTAFEQVINCCATTPRTGQVGTWITEEMQKAYLNLHQAGLAHSVEVWQNNILVGGLYGIKINKVFCGESMFSHVSNASKAALIYLCKNLGFDLIDCQMPNEHLMSLGAKMISRDAYLHYLSSS